MKTSPAELQSNASFLYFENLSDAVQIAPDSIVSRTLRADGQAKMIVFGFDTGQELSEHTASVPAIIHFLRGEAELSLGGELQKATAGTWAWMPANLPHSIVAKTPVVMLLTMLKNLEADPGAKEEPKATNGN